jgi:hypothetical protein
MQTWLRQCSVQVSKETRTMRRMGGCGYAMRQSAAEVAREYDQGAADAMILALDETERLLTRLAQEAPPTGIHLIIGALRRDWPEDIPNQARKPERQAP